MRSGLRIDVREYRPRLIADVITCKLDVQGGGGAPAADGNNEMARSSELIDTGMIESPSHDQLRRPSYTVAEAGRLVGLTAERVRRWLRGYEYSYGDAVRGQPPVVLQGRGPPSPYASFLDLVDLLFVKRFLDHGVSLQKVRRALDEAREVLGTNHFARQTFFTDGGAIFLRLKEGAQRGRETRSSS